MHGVSEYPTQRRGGAEAQRARSFLYMDERRLFAVIARSVATRQARQTHSHLRVCSRDRHAALAMTVSLYILLWRGAQRHGKPDKHTPICEYACRDRHAALAMTVFPFILSLRAQRSNLAPQTASCEISPCGRNDTEQSAFIHVHLRIKNLRALCVSAPLRWVLNHQRSLRQNQNINPATTRRPSPIRML